MFSSPVFKRASDNGVSHGRTCGWSDVFKSDALFHSAMLCYSSGVSRCVSGRYPLLGLQDTLLYIIRRAWEVSKVPRGVRWRMASRSCFPAIFSLVPQLM